MSLLTVTQLGKAYRSYASELHRVASWFGMSIRARKENWVLREVSFAIEPGEAVGLVGQNGAGKSTLLKLIAGTLQPTEGTVAINGRIAAILELGMGFNTELSGRQNAYHAAGLMGFTVEQIDGVIGQIEAFAEIGRYFDQPVRMYSSGMQVRVAFAVATAFRPEILIVDEALSVGDLYFQHKCFERIREFRQQGTTLLIVSHDRDSILSLCDRAILLEAGRVLRDGRPEEVMDYYNALIADKEQATVQVSQLDDGSMQTRSGSGEARIESVTLCNVRGESVETLAVGEPVTLRIRVRIERVIPELVVGYVIKDRYGQSVYGTNTSYLQHTQRDLRAGETVEYRFAFNAALGVGSYSVALALHASESHVAKNYEWRDLALVFSVVNLDKPQFVGTAWMPPKVECIR
ncbi:ABC transporter ATP-binding protein [Stutzerimonas kunmingensis]|uniref:ABC transporter ATP-binding protein n=1 Tax=Stutzerimonas kunmingensis TaxID=1211807 RepID=UPI00241D76B4|nr:ABC transporter ATP-binding protein [Stutzerimonas kunmingensis]